jgi:hypothetical protein
LRQDLPVGDAVEHSQREENHKRGVHFGPRCEPHWHWTDGNNGPKRTSLRPRVRVGKQKGNHARKRSDDRVVQRSGRKYSFGARSDDVKKNGRTSSRSAAVNSTYPGEKMRRHLPPNYRLRLIVS